MPKLSEILGEGYSQIPQELQTKYKDIDLVDSSQCVAKTDYDNIKNQFDTTSKTIKELQKNNKDNDTLQSTIKEHEKTIESLKKQNIRDKKESIIKLNLKDLGCNDPDYLIYKHGGVDNFETDELGKIKDFDNIVKTYKESIPHIFPKKEELIHPQPGDGQSSIGGRNPFSKQYFNLTEQGRVFKENPTLAKQLQQQAENQ